MAKHADQSSEHQPSEQHLPGTGKYTVVARRYRPKTFAELVGQSTVAHALLTAIQSNRVGHAYLFTGARGVGKTSTARIFAKALNASMDDGGTFDPNSEMSLAIDAGEDMDVLEIDGASNRGIDEIRQLRANAAVRPSRSKYKIYIIDEVHMLTTQAFNALLKTLEEPPGHVKFIFCTTDPEKIPITVLSRCQRFDFPPVSTEQIFERLKFICIQEGCKADDAALRLIARRAAGSMRDSQSLLEQLLSFGGNTITTQSVHDMLGIADEARLESFVHRLMERDAAGAFQELDGAVASGVDVGQLADQLLGYLRDIMLVSVGGSPDLMRTANPNSAAQMGQWGKAWGTMTILSGIQILDDAMVKMRHSVQGRVLLEIAFVQICHLQDLQALSDLVKAISTGGPVPLPRIATAAASSEAKIASDAKKKVDLEDTSNPSIQSPVNTPGHGASQEIHAISPEQDTMKTSSRQAAVPSVSAQALSNAPRVVSGTEESWKDQSSLRSSDKDHSSDIASNEKAESANAAHEMGEVGLLELFRNVAESMGGFAKQCAEHCIRVERTNASLLKIVMTQDAAPIRDYFLIGNNNNRLVQAISQRMNYKVGIQFELSKEAIPNSRGEGKFTQSPQVSQPSPNVSTNQSKLIREAMNHPLVQQFVEVFGGEVIRVDPAQAQSPVPHLSAHSNPKSGASSLGQDSLVEETV